MYWYETTEYLNELPDLVSTLNNNALYSNEGQIVVDTYSVDFSENETKKIIALYVTYCMSNKTYITDFNDSSWLANPFFKYIVSHITNTELYSWTSKGVRDRVWVILVELAKLNNKWYKPYQFQLEYEESTKKTEPSSDVVPVVPTTDDKKNKIMKFVLIGAASLAISKVLKLW